MNRISGDIALSQYLANSAHSKQKVSTAGTPFQQLLASATASASVSQTGAVTATTAISPTSVPAPSGASKFVSDMNAALSAYGISTPPSLRITSGPDGLQLSDDDRNGKFQAMIQNNPALGQSINGMLGAATLGRKGALNDAVQGFGGKNPSAAMSDFLHDFKESEEPRGFSVSFNGASASVDEMGANGWQPVKDKGAFNSELLAAYAKYLVKFGVTTEKDKDQAGNNVDNDADIDLKKKLAQADAG
jgi:hypothetical protein